MTSAPPRCQRNRLPLKADAVASAFLVAAGENGKTATAGGGCRSLYRHLGITRVPR